MKIRKILDTTSHRPWELPDGDWKFYQEWNQAIFLHWKVDLDKLNQFVPRELEIDLFRGEPWVSVVAFTMENIRPRRLPAFYPISNFEEINIRTYVKSNGKTGVYFLSIEGGKRVSCKIAKSISELPYRFSRMKRNEGSYYSSNKEYGDGLGLEFELGPDLDAKTELDKWLTERYALFQDSGESINEFEIHHLEWPIKTIELKKMEISYPRFDQLIQGKPQLTHYSDGVQVIAWNMKKTGCNNV
ncbi:YqjF family protein [Luteirhabdus pelagi]|uniref:YqjF family protein n=1 Tax=Luteirhabdus pelagi TaxID=2792783 RepID=UPI001939EBC3|nr:DUF2071 domain-containing protein [Luteirhabdus pelagi]